jgi:hypothetical protein
MGDAVWPEENFALVVWCEEEEARRIARTVAAVKEQFPDEGIKLFGLSADPQISRFPVNPPAPSAADSSGYYTAAPLHALSASFVAAPNQAPADPPADQVETEYDGQNMEEL